MFQYYNSWTLAMLLGHTGSMLHAHPKVFFESIEFTNAGVCQSTGNSFSFQYTSAHWGFQHMMCIERDLKDCIDGKQNAQAYASLNAAECAKLEEIPSGILLCSEALFKSPFAPCTVS